MDSEAIRTVAGLLLGFQVTAFSWRVTRESAMGDKQDTTWLPPADWVNLGSIVVLALGVFLMPLLGGSQRIQELSVGLGVVLTMGYPFALAGHYDMYNRHTARSFDYAPFQERVAVSVIAIVALAYVLFWWHAA